MASRASSAVEGEIFKTQHKANSLSRPGEHRIDKSNRAFGLDGAMDSYGYNERSPSRSPSPYRRKRTRSPSPYRRKRNDSRSPSPYRHGRAGGNQDANGAGWHSKRKASPPHGGRPDKRYQIDRNRHDNFGTRAQREDIRGILHSTSRGDNKPPKPISYADNENPTAVPDFGDGLKKSHQPSRDHKNDRSRDLRQQVTHGKRQSTASSLEGLIEARQQPADVDMQSPGDEPSEILVSQREESAPAPESREEKRRRWAAIRAAAEKEKAKDNLLQMALLTNASETASAAASPLTVSSPLAATSPPAAVANSPLHADSPLLGDLNSMPTSPHLMIIDKQEGSEANSPSANGQPAANYDPAQDMLDDRDRATLKAQQTEVSANTYSETNPEALTTLPAQKVESVKKQEQEFDMFDFDEDDKEDTKATAAIDEQVTTNAKGTVLDEKLLDNWDDAEGYYKIISNELVNNGRYRMIKTLGRGVFANVAQAEDVQMQPRDKENKLVAIKMIRKNDLMRKASQKEMDFLRKVNHADPQDKRHIIRLLGSFDHKGHLCAVFEHMSKNLRDLLKEDTNGHGLSLQAVRTYSRQMFIGLQHLHNCQVVHCDLKPDNILVSPDKKTIKLCDFGTAVDKRDIMERTEYLVSRFYRAPEIILGMDIGYGIDLWAIGCTAYELWTGKILFTGRTNNQMVKSFMDCLGWPTEKLLKKCLTQNILEHFEAGPPLRFISREVDQHGHPSIRKIEQQKKIPRDLKTRVHEAAQGIAQGGPTTTELNDFADLLGACLNMNVDKRIQPKEALAHKFFPQPKVVPRPAVVKPTMMKRGSAFRR